MLIGELVVTGSTYTPGCNEFKLSTRITKKDIVEGKACDENSCPGAIAILRELPEGSRVWVGTDGVTLWIPPYSSSDRYVAKTPDILATFIGSLDNEDHVRRINLVESRDEKVVYKGPKAEPISFSLEFQWENIEE